MIIIYKPAKIRKEIRRNNRVVRLIKLFFRPHHAVISSNFLTNLGRFIDIYHVNTLIPLYFRKLSKIKVYFKNKLIPANTIDISLSLRLKRVYKPGLEYSAEYGKIKSFETKWAESSVRFL